MRHQMFNQHGEAVFFAVGSRFHVSRFYPVKSRLIGMMKVEVTRTTLHRLSRP